MPAAGTKILEFFQTPMGEEIMEGSLGGLMAGIPLFWQDNDPGSAALQTATAMLGGIGLGMAGRRVGAAIGKAIKPGELENQQSMLANMARIGGSEGTTMDATMDFIQGQRAIIGDQIRGGMVEKVRVDAKTMNPTEFQAKHGISVDEFEQFDRINSKLGGEAMDASAQAQQKFAEMMEEAIAEAAARGEAPEIALDLGAGLAGGIARTSKEKPLAPVTGEEVGRVIGRFIGDEVGILGGSALGAYAATQMGFETPKDREIRRLKEELQALQ
ncbi:hypothetical protein VZG28_04720 [Synechococcus elongatus IITB4]|uniref:hypothetical protein n=1 Tax=Synechococcus elongatus TaxID=32046 RepID=UPI0030D5BC7D